MAGYYIMVKYTSSALFSFHSILQNVGQQLGYPLFDAGICHGITIRWLEACLTGSEEEFAKRIKLIEDFFHRHYANHIVGDINDHMISHDILAFFDSVFLFQYSHTQSDLFGKITFCDDITQVSKIVSSDACLLQGGLCVEFRDEHILTLHELDAWLQETAQAIASSACQELAGFTLSSNIHATGLMYYPSKQEWHYMDVNGDSLVISNNTKDIADSIFKQLAQYREYLCFRINLVELKNSEQHSKLRAVLSDIRQNRVITKETALRSTDRSSLLQLSIVNEHKDRVKLLLKLGADPNKPTEHGCTPLIFAIERGGDAEIVELLLKLGAAPNIPAHSSATPLFYAAQYGHKDIVELLLKHNASEKIYFTSSDKRLRQFADRNGDVGIKQRMDVIIDHKLKQFHDPSKISLLPKDIAWVMGHKAIFTLLIKISSEKQPEFFAAYDNREKMLDTLEESKDITKKNTVESSDGEITPQYNLK